MTSSNPTYLPKAPPRNTITLGVGVSTHEFWGDTNIQSITEDLGKPGGYQPLIAEQREATGGICTGDDPSLLCLAPARFTASHP